MYRRVMRFVRSLQGVHGRLNHIEELQERVLINQGVALSAINSSRTISSLGEVEFKVFSQWGEDGIIQYLTQNIEIKNKTFIEFGVENFAESNCRFLMMKDNWSGFVIDGSESNIQALRASPYFWRYDLKALCSFITKDNIAGLLEDSGFDKDVGILSIDIDGMDYWVAVSLTNWRPCILIMEYNAVFGVDRAIVVPYEASFQRTKAHHSNLYFGLSLKALYILAKRWGYGIVGTNDAGNNAFFVRRDLLNDRVKEVDLAVAYSASKFRESRDERGQLTFVHGHERLKLIKGMPVFDVEASEVQML
jgi:hypothetical protein